MSGLIDVDRLPAEPAASVWQSLATARRRLAEAWLELPDTQVHAAFASELGALHRLIAESGIRRETPLQADLTVMEQIQQALRENKPLSPGLLLAAVLFFYPHQFGRIVTVEQVPEYLLDHYLRMALDWPALLRYEAEAEAFAQYMTAWLHALLESSSANANSPAWRTLIERVATSLNLAPAYFTNLNLRPLMATRARLIEQALQSRGFQIDLPPAPRSDRSRLRLGILAPHFGPQTETFATLPVYRHLDRAQFEVLLLSPQSANDPLERFCASVADQYIVLPRTISEQVQRIRQLDLDIIWIATNLTAVTSEFALLGAHRTARMQVASVCSCVTTGFRNIDCYVSGRLSEPASAAQDHYTEKLLTIDGPAHCYDFAPEVIPAPKPAALSRSDVNIPAGVVVFASGANFFKILPELDAVWARILAAAPGSRLLLYPFNPNWYNGYPVRPFIERIEANFARHGVSMDRVSIFDVAPDRSPVLSRLALADIYLDSFPFAGATSLLDPLQLHIPCVVKDGVTFRSLVGPALLRSIGLDEFVAPDVPAYIDLAVKLATDADYRAQAKTRFAAAMANAPAFYDTEKYADRVGRALIQAWNSIPR
jgi:predicted O-linked N-acetylglucosamine transferase (SPINDLY family)